jgi:hypothetical protein
VLLQHCGALLEAPANYRLELRLLLVAESQALADFLHARFHPHALFFAQLTLAGFAGC